VNRRPACAKLNLALVVGARTLPAGRHELTTVFQRIDLTDRITVEPAATLSVHGFPADTLVERALRLLAREAGVLPRFRARIEKAIPVAAGLGGGSSDAATALRLANALLPSPLDPALIRRLATSIGADVPFFLEAGPQLGERDGSTLSPVRLPQDYWVVLVLPAGAKKLSTAEVYAAYSRREGAAGYADRRQTLLEALTRVERAADLAALPPNDLASSPLAGRLRQLGAFRADVSGAGPVVYGLFANHGAARSAERALRAFGSTWLTVPAWYF